MLSEDFHTNCRSFSNRLRLQIYLYYIYIYLFYIYIYLYYIYIFYIYLYYIYIYLYYIYISYTCICMSPSEYVTYVHTDMTPLGHSAHVRYCATYVCICVTVCTHHRDRCVCKCVCAHVCIHVWRNTFLYTRKCVPMHAYTHVCGIHVCTQVPDCIVYVYMHVTVRENVCMQNECYV